ncbi:MAG TPA: GntR family transcriptional regulator [Lacisediminihabitans sp.]|uniref:GntR family transcriptional regulator n=1 Tax=Lacisediminihabitans sp. TaxID=2787631 RepID=UPI002ED7D9B9
MTQYRHVADSLTGRILEGEFPPGASLPSETALAGEYAVSRGTVRGALAALAREGMLTSRQGSGWMVHSGRHAHNFEQLRSFAQWARSKGMEPGGRVISMETDQATVDEARSLRLTDRAPVLRVLRIRSLDGRDVMLERTTYATWMIPVVQAIPPGEASVVQIMNERFGILTAHADHVIDAVAASTDDAELLGVRRSSPLLRLRRQSFEPSGRAIERSDDRYLPGAIAFQVHASATENPLERTVK